MTNASPPISKHVDLFPLGKDETPYRKLTSDYVSTVEIDGKSFLKVEPEAIRLLAEEAFSDINHLLRPGHLAQLASILDAITTNRIWIPAFPSSTEHTIFSSCPRTVIRQVPQSPSRFSGQLRC